MTDIDFESYKEIAFERHGAILEVILNRPETGNASSPELHRELAKVFDDLANDRSVNVVVLTGSGTVFSAGVSDVGWMRSLGTAPQTEMRRILWEGKKIIESLLELPQPIIAMVNGHAIGLGATLALHCDLVLADEAALIGDPHVRSGIAAGDGGCVIWPLLINPQQAKRYLLTGDLVTGKEAEALGLVLQSLPAADLRPAVMKLAEKLAAGAPVAIQWTKASINRVVLQRMHDVIDTSLAGEALSFASADYQEALDALEANRKPVFTGR